MLPQLRLTLFAPLILCAVAASAQEQGSAGEIVPLFNERTQLEPDTIIDTPEALITRVGDRVRDRHAREGMFRAYDHYLAHYFENRTVTIEIIDRVAKGGDSITYNRLRSIRSTSRTSAFSSKAREWSRNT